MLLTWVKLFHTLVFGVMFGAILFLLYCGLTNQLTVWTAIAFALISVEVVIYTANRFRCPLRTWAETLTPPGQAIQDIYLPPWLSARVVAISTPLLGLPVCSCWGGCYRDNSIHVGQPITPPE